MIRNYSDFKYYIECDRVALRATTKTPRLWGDEIWKFQILLRKRELLANTIQNHNILLRMILSVYSLFLRMKYRNMQFKLGYSIPLNVFGPGLSIAHHGTIVVASNAHIGANCRIHEGVTIGATNGTNDAATIGDNVFIGTGAKIIGGVVIGNNVAIAANAVVVKDVLCESGCTVGGVPAKVISTHNSHSNLVLATDIVNKRKASDIIG